MKISEPKFWWNGNPSILIRLMSLPFGIFLKILIFFRNKLFKKIFLPKPVICVGNFVVGGQGKTPFVRYLRSVLEDIDRKTVVISNGYGGKMKSSKIISDIDSSIDCGDEALLHAKDGLTVVSKRRADALEVLDKNQFDLQQRIGFLEQAGALEEEITNKEIALARIRLNVIQEENKLSGSTKEDLELEAQLQADLIALETARLTKQKEVTGQIIALRTEEQAKVDADKLKAEADKQKELDDEAAFTLAQREALAISEEEKTALLVTKAQERFDAKTLFRGYRTHRI